MMDDAEEVLKRELNTSTLTEITDRPKGYGTISNGKTYKTDSGTVFVKYNSHPESLELFQGEYEGLVAVLATNTLSVPKPIKVIKNPLGGAMLALDYMEIKALSDYATLGQDVARLHLYNDERRRQAEKQAQFITSPKEDRDDADKFGFHITTHCGFFPQPNEWMDNWVDFYARKMENHVRIAEEKYNDRDIRPVWASLMPKLPKLFRDIEVRPALLHGDLWRGNIGETREGPVAFDPIALYGHTEFEISIAHVHSGFDNAYFNNYHNILPKQPGFEDRLDLYLLHHYFQLWNHYGPDYSDENLLIVEREVHRGRFGKGYKQSTLDLIENLDKKLS